MIIAVAPDGNKRSPHQTGERGSCPGCAERVDAVVGEIVIPHWRHVGNRDRDSWSEGESDWHAQWKIEAKRASFGIEVGYTDPIHRADAVSPRGVIYEFQHSGLTLDELAERSWFYSQRGPLVWVFDASGPWTRRWHKWRRDGQDWHGGLVILDEPDTDHLWLMSPLEEGTKRINRGDLFGQQVLARAMRCWWETKVCATCGKTMEAFFPDGSGTSRCSHEPLRGERGAVKVQPGPFLTATESATSERESAVRVQ